MSNNANSQAKEDIYLVNLTFGQCSITLYVGSCNNTAECVSELFCLKSKNILLSTFHNLQKGINVLKNNPFRFFFCCNTVNSWMSHTGKSKQSYLYLGNAML